LKWGNSLQHVPWALTLLLASKSLQNEKDII
jgi:hypothetical protein